MRDGGTRSQRLVLLLLLERQVGMYHCAECEQYTSQEAHSQGCEASSGAQTLHDGDATVEAADKVR